MYKISGDKAQKDAHRHTSRLSQLEAEMLSAVPGEGSWRCLLAAWLECFFYNGLLQNKSRMLISLFPCFGKGKILFGFLSACENWYKCRSFLKEKWPKVPFQKAGDTSLCIIIKVYTHMFPRCLLRS